VVIDADLPLSFKLSTIDKDATMDHLNTISLWLIHQQSNKRVVYTTQSNTCGTNRRWSHITLLGKIQKGGVEKHEQMDMPN
jgi:hypothetical protein